MQKEEILQYRVSGLISRAAAYILLNLALLGTAIAGRVQSEELEIVDGEVIHCFTASTTQTGIIQVLDNTSTRAVGRSDFDKGKLADDRAICFDRVELWYAGESASDITLSGSYSPHMFALAGTALMNTKILNGYLRIYVNNKPVLQKQVAECVNWGREYQGVNNFGEIAIPKAIKPNTSVRIEIELPNGVTLGGTNTHYFKIKLKGAVTDIKPGA